MKAAIISLFVVGFAILLFGGYLMTRCLYSPEVELHFTDVLIVIAGGVMSLTAVFLRLRVRAGGRVFELTEQDRKEVQDLRTELNPRNLLARLLIPFGVIFVLAGFAAGFQALLAHPKAWTGLLVDLSLVSLGVLFLLSSVILARKR